MIGAMGALSGAKWLALLGDSGAGALHPDLRQAAFAALQIEPEQALARAKAFEWHQVVTQFIEHLVPARPAPALPCHETVAIRS